jgi:uncharacterized membrane protein
MSVQLQERNAEIQERSTKIHQRNGKRAVTGQKPAGRKVNVGPIERAVSVAAGAALLWTATAGRKTRLSGLALAGALLYRGLSGQCHLYRVLGIDRSAKHHDGAVAAHGVHFDRTVIIASPPGKIFEFWRNGQNLPKIIDHLETVEMTGPKHSKWVAKGPLGAKWRWEAEITDERPPEFLAWKSLAGSEIDTTGSLRLEKLTHDRGTAVRLVLAYQPPGGRLTATLSRWFGANVESELFEGLRRMKQILEAGEIPTVDHQPQGRCVRQTTPRRKS